MTRFVFVLALGVSVLSLLTSVGSVFADFSESASGWAWGGTEASGDGVINGDETGLGWVSFNSSNCDSDFDGLSDGATGCPSSGTSVADYGVHIPSGDGSVSGYAWSENVGWISFQPGDLASCPSGACSAFRSSDEIHGWARILSIPNEGANAGGYEGWIKLFSESGDPTSYGITIDTSADPDEANGFAWSDEFGWLRMESVTIQDSESMIVCPTSATITISGTFQLRAYYRASSRILSCTDLVGATDVTADASTSWTSADPSVVTVDSTTSKGLITGVSTGGPIDITVSYAGNSTTMPVVVSGISASCGNGVVDAGEACDEGSGNNGSCTTATDADSDGDTCSAACQINICQCI